VAADPGVAEASRTGISEDVVAVVARPDDVTAPTREMKALVRKK
jgi:hypothetical protein